MFKLVTKFPVPEGTHTVLVVTANHWGRGKDKAEAMANCKRFGGHPAQAGYVAYYFGEGFKEDTGWVDQMGMVHWEYEADAKPWPVKEELLYSE